MLGFQTAGPLLKAQSGNPIPAENQLPGNPKSEWDIIGSGNATIQGFATDISVNKGGTISFKVTTTASTFSINIYRLGYYQGNGARKVATIPNVTGKSQAACLTQAASGLYDCGNWTVSTSWNVPATAVSGIYIARLIRTDNGGASHVPFIVRDDAAQADVVLQASDPTWQAYNQYGGHSLYLGSPIRGYKASYNRPFATRGQSSGYGASNYVFYAEYPMIRWLEANGYNVKYIAGLDTDRFGSALSGAVKPKVFLSIGHDEYWSGGQRASVEAARAAGVNLAFFSGNDVFWKTRWEPSIDGSNTPNRTLVTYKETHANGPLDPADPPTWTGTWRDPRFSPPGDGGRPENALTGQLFTVNRGTAPITVPGKYAGLRFWRNTGVAALQQNQTLSLAIDTLGYEWDEDLDNGFRPAGSIQMSQTVVSVPERVQDFGSTYLPGTATHHITLYKHSSGALVFGAGTVQWIWGLDPNHDVDSDFGSSAPDVNMRQATLNLLADMRAQPATIQSGLIPTSASTDVTRPSSAITSPAVNANIAAGTVVTVTGTAADTGGGVVAGVEVSTDGGSTWRRATGTTSWSYQFAPGVLGPASIRSRATDDSGNLEQPATNVPVTITQGNCPCSIWAPSLTVPWMVDSNDGAAVEVGLKFRTDVGGIVNGLRFYKSAANTGTHTGHLWTASGQLLASLTFTGESASGWQQMNFASQVIIQPGTTYVISYFAPRGHYSDDQFYLGASGVDSWPLHALKSGVDGPNGVFNYGASGFPTETWFSDSYGVDVLFTPDLTAPTVSLTAPANGANISGNAVTVSATASDNLAVAGVQFKIDGANLNAEDTTSPYSISWNSNLTSNGTHSLTAVARDSAGNLTTSAAVSVSVFNNDTVAPTVAISSPLNTATVKGTVSVKATATDNQGVAGVQFLVDGASFGAEQTTPPYTIPWDTTGLSNNSTHTLAARARDTSGNQTTSASNTVTISNPVVGAPAIDAMVWADQPTNQTTAVSPAFSTTSGNELLLAFVSADYLGGASTTVTGVSGAGATWALVGRTNVQSGTAEIWRAFAPSPLTNAVVTAALSQAVDSSMTVISFSNVDTSGTSGSGAIGATGTANAISGAPSASLTTTRNNSWVFGVGTDFDNAVARTVGPNQTVVHQYLAPVGDTYWVQRILTPTPVSPTSVTINDTAPAADRFNLFIVEIKPSTTTDPTPPTVSMTAPANGATVSGSNVTVSATASDNVAVAGVQFKLDGNDLGAEVTTSPYSLSWNTTSVANGSHSLTAVARDTSSNTATATAVTVTVNNVDGTAPTVAMTAPANGATVSGASVAVSATAADNVAVLGVQFLLDGVNLGAEDTASPYAISWNSIGTANGTHSLGARARDGAGNTTTAAVTVTVNNDTTPPTVSITAPANGATVSGTVTVNASAADNVAVAGVQFKLDGANFGAEDTASPYSISWDTTTATNASHTLTAVARDAAGNTATAAATVTVNNADGTPPTVSGTTPAAGATGVGTASLVTATFSEPINAATLTTSTFVLRDPSNAIVTATVSYDAPTRVATLTPAAALSVAKTYTATITGGSSGVKDLAGNALASNFVWSFTTVASMTIWNASATPSGIATDDGSAVELGMKFQSDVAGKVTGVRFYKGATNTGTHTGTLWSSTGTKLATATFSGETASGWQQVTFTTAVNITANTVYVVSYHTTVGNYAFDEPYFAAGGVDSVPLHALQDGVSGGNGVYIYGASLFPNQTWNSSNYWVDIVFVPN